MNTCSSPSRSSALSLSDRPSGKVRSSRALLRLFSLAGAIVLGGGCANAADAPSDKTPAQTAPTAQVVSPDGVVTNSTTTNEVAGVTNIQNVTVVQVEEPKVSAPDGVKLTPAVEAVVKMVNSGVGEEAILAYVQRSPAEYEMDAETIVFLSDLGISSAVLAAMLNNDSALEAAEKTELAAKAAAVAPAAEPIAPQEMGAPEPETASLPPAQPQLGNGYVAAPANPNAPAETEAPQQQVVVAAPPQVIYTTPPVEVTQNYFYSPLAPYGSWVYVGSYGWCWRPTVAVYDTGWRPYHSRGRWIWSDSGWYWHSDYSWGWAAFHYGRWTCPPGVGWIWSPDYTWGPAWVSWRRSSYHCGWAPLPPSAHWRSGFGLSFHSRNVGVSFDFGLSHHDYTFIPTRYFCERDPWRYSVGRPHTVNIYNDTTVVNNYIVGDNNTIINNGVGHDFIASNARSEIRKVSIREASGMPLGGSRRGTVIAPDKVHRVGEKMVVYRPTAPPARSTTDLRSAPPATEGRLRTAPRSTARAESSFANRPGTTINSRPGSSLVSPSRRPEPLTSPTALGESRGGFASRPRSPIASGDRSDRTRIAQPRRSPLPGGDLATRPIGSGLVTEQATRSARISSTPGGRFSSVPSTRPSAAAPTPTASEPVASRPTGRPQPAPAAIGNASPSTPDSVSRRMNTVRREGINARLPESSVPRSISSAPRSDLGNPQLNTTRPSAPLAARSESPRIRRIEPIRTPAPIAAPSVTQPQSTPSFRAPRPSVPTQLPENNIGRSEIRPISPRFGNSRGAYATPQQAPTYSSPAPTLSQPVQRPSFRSAPTASPRFQSPAVSQPAPTIHSQPRFSAPVHNPAPVARPSAPIQSQPQYQRRPSFPTSPAPQPQATPSFRSRPQPMSPGIRTPSGREQIHR